jgi:hypothetical protein
MASLGHQWYVSLCSAAAHEDTSVCSWAESSMMYVRMPRRQLREACAIWVHAARAAVHRW